MRLRLLALNLATIISLALLGALVWALPYSQQWPISLSKDADAPGEPRWYTLAVFKGVVSWSYTEWRHVERDGDEPIITDSPHQASGAVQFANHDRNFTREIGLPGPTGWSGFAHRDIQLRLPVTHAGRPVDRVLDAAEWRVSYGWIVAALLVIPLYRVYRAVRSRPSVSVFKQSLDLATLACAAWIAMVIGAQIRSLWQVDVLSVAHRAVGPANYNALHNLSFEVRAVERSVVFRWWRAVPSDVLPHRWDGYCMITPQEGRPIDLAAVRKDATFQMAGLASKHSQMPLVRMIDGALSGAMGHYGTVLIPTWMLIVPVAWIGLVHPLLAALAWRRRRKRRRQGLCIHCGYDLRSSPDRCPECGVETAKPPVSVPAAS